MLTPPFGRCIGLSALVCVLLMFFFPLAHGNFQSTHGPVTALRAKRNLIALVLSIVNATLLVFAMLVLHPLFHSRGRMGSVTMGSAHLDLIASGSILRC